MRTTANPRTKAAHQRPRGPITIRSVAAPPAKPIYIRLPPQGQLCPFSALTRAKLNTLILGDHPTVESIVLPNAGKNQKGCRLIVYESLMRYLEGLRSKPDDQAA